MPKNSQKSAILIVFMLLLASCQKNINPTPGSTPAQKIASYNAALAEANRSLAAGSIELQRSGTLSDAQVRSVLSLCELTANASEGIRIALIQSNDWTATAAQIQKLLGMVKVSQWLASSGISNQQVSALVAAISSTISLISLEASR